MSEWRGEDERTIVTAIDILHEADKENRKAEARGGKRAPGAGGPQYSG